MSSPSAQMIEKSMADTLQRLTVSGRYNALIVQLILSALFWPYIPIWPIGLVLGFSILGTAFSDVIRQKYIDAPNYNSAITWQRQYAYCSIISGSSWGLAGFLWFFPNELANQAVMFATLIAMILGSVLTRSACLPAFVAFTATILAFFLGRMLISAPSAATTFCILGGLLVLSSIGWAKNINKNYRKTAELTLKNERLIIVLEAAVADANSANKAKADFLAIISHELRTPLNGIFGMTELLKLSGSVAVTGDSYINAIESSTAALSVVLTDIISMSAIHTDTVHIQEDVINLKGLATVSETLFKQQANEKGVLLASQVAPNLPDILPGDAGRLRQILFNLIGNAVKFTTEGSVNLLISASDTEAPKTKIGDTDTINVTFSVTDTGIGIAAKDREKAFDPFSQVDSPLHVDKLAPALGLPFAAVSLI
jgi:signal transduction histidine kinase